MYGIMEGTFTEPVKTPGGETIQSTGKLFKLPMATFSHWTKDGKMGEEYPFRDNETYRTQLSLAEP